jgi:Family of unknown function (DUF6498)
VSTVDRLIAWYRVSSSVGAVVALVVANLIPLAGVLFLGWNVWTILLLYWMENGVVGVFNVLKILRAEGHEDDAGNGPRVNGRPASAMSKAGLVPFFVIHYGMFWVVHGIFVVTLPLFGMIGDLADGQAEMPGVLEGVQPLTVGFALIALTISHGVSYWFNFIGRGEFRRATPSGQMFAPYGRLVVLHITIIFGALAISFTGAPEAAVVILVVLKIALDLGLHLAEHRPKGPASAADPDPARA